MDAPLIELAPWIQRSISYALLIFAAIWLVRHFSRLRKHGGCAKCPAAPAPRAPNNRVSLPVLR